MAASRSSRVTRSSVGLNGLDENFCGRTLRNRSIAQPEEGQGSPLPGSRAPRSPKKRQDDQAGASEKPGGHQGKVAHHKAASVDGETCASPRKRVLSCSEREGVGGSEKAENCEGRGKETSGAVGRDASPLLKRAKRCFRSGESHGSKDDLPSAPVIPASPCAPLTTVKENSEGGDVLRRNSTAASPSSSSPDLNKEEGEEDDVGGHIESDGHAQQPLNSNSHKSSTGLGQTSSGPDAQTNSLCLSAASNTTCPGPSPALLNGSKRGAPCPSPPDPIVPCRNSDPGQEEGGKDSDHGQEEEGKDSDPGQEEGCKDSDPGQEVECKDSDPGQEEGCKDSDPGQEEGCKDSDPGQEEGCKDSDPGQEEGKDSDPGQEEEGKDSDPGQEVECKDSDPGQEEGKDSDPGQEEEGKDSDPGQEEEGKYFDPGQEEGKDSDPGQEEGKDSDPGQEEGCKDSDPGQEEGKDSDPGQEEEGKDSDPGQEEGKDSDPGQEEGKDSDPGQEEGCKDSDPGQEEGKDSDPGQEEGKDSDPGQEVECKGSDPGQEEGKDSDPGQEEGGKDSDPGQEEEGKDSDPGQEEGKDSDPGQEEGCKDSDPGQEEGKDSDPGQEEGCKDSDPGQEEGCKDSDPGQEVECKGSDPGQEEGKDSDPGQEEEGCKDSDPGQEVECKDSDPGQEEGCKDSDPGQEEGKDSDPGQEEEGKDSDPGQEVECKDSDPGQEEGCKDSDPGQEVECKGSDPGQEKGCKDSDPGQEEGCKDSDPGQEEGCKDSDPGQEEGKDSDPGQEEGKDSDPGQEEEGKDSDPGQEEECKNSDPGQEEEGKESDPGQEEEGKESDPEQEKEGKDSDTGQEEEGKDSDPGQEEEGKDSGEGPAPLLASFEEDSSTPHLSVREEEVDVVGDSVCREEVVTATEEEEEESCGGGINGWSFTPLVVQNTVATSIIINNNIRNVNNINNVNNNNNSTMPLLAPPTPSDPPCTPSISGTSPPSFTEPHEHRYTLRTLPRRAAFGGGKAVAPCSSPRNPLKDGVEEERELVATPTLSAGSSIQSREWSLLSPPSVPMEQGNGGARRDRVGWDNRGHGELCETRGGLDSKEVPGGGSQQEDEEEDPDVYYFESDHLTLKHNKDYQRLLHTVGVLEAQRTQSILDLERLARQQREALRDPVSFVEQLQKQVELDLPRPQRVVQLPDISWDQYTSGLGDFEREFCDKKRTTRRLKLIFDKVRLPVGPKSPLDPKKEEEGESSTLYSALPSSDAPENSSNSQMIRGRLCHQIKPDTFNQLWTVEEQKKLEHLLLKFSPEEVESKRWQKIADALGNRTTKQVASRVQKYFIKLTKAGISVPGRTPNMCIYSKKVSNKRQHHLNKHLYRPSTFLTSYEPPVYMDEEDERAAYYSALQDPDGDDTDEEGVPVELRHLPEYKELLELKRMKKHKLQEIQAESSMALHHGYKCDVCGMQPIQGLRWHCQDCPSDNAVDFCSDCLYKTESHAPSHHLEPVHHHETFLDRDYCLAQTPGYNYLDPNYYPANR
ncbi:ZZ-type zinc finger-containing protein 3-like isoform X1 [Salvelinus fontinalis]|uniref:ZZ-type zinc finger-containing protein 3-like isoform X1 n=1 Tax=Salvelinus fontinalis TaxID=8038 RepID=UPI00248563F4|nr:ZZ-type zinc finger-containing protein 3-like isoform X1 [Salvelinus fontinalis]